MVLTKSSITILIDDLIFDWWDGIIISKRVRVMKSENPPFEINERIMADVIEIAELVGRASVSSKISTNPTLRRTNRIRTIYSSLAIEQNTLDIEQVTAILSGKTAERACFDDGIAEELYVWGFAGPSGVQIYSKQIKNSL